MHRLRLIKYLKDAYLPLNRIKELLDSLTENQIVPLLNEFEADPISALAALQALPVFNQESEKAQSPDFVKNNNALNYINQIRGDRVVRENRSELKSSLPRPSNQSIQRDALKPAEEWRRVELAPGVELHVKLPVNARTQRLIDRMIDLSRDLKS